MREKVIKDLGDLHSIMLIKSEICPREEVNYWIELQESLADALAMLKEQPDIVRCKDCHYWQDNNNGYPHPDCRWGHDETPDPDDYCSFGERKEGR